MAEVVPLAVAVAIGLLLAATGIVTALVVRAAAQGRLARNPYVGIRIRATLRSNSGWREGHAAAGAASDIAGAGLVVAGAALPFFRDVAGLLVVSLLAGAWAVGWSVVAMARAGRVAVDT